jgi:hypothetical protein
MSHEVRHMRKKLTIGLVLLASVIVGTSHKRHTTSHGRLKSTPNTCGAPGPLPTFSNDHSMVFNGTNTYIFMGNVAPFTTLDWNTPTCVSVWFLAPNNIGPTSNNGVLIAKQPLAAPGNVWIVVLHGSGGAHPRLQLFDNITHYFDEYTTTGYNDNAWHNAIWSYDGTPTNGHLSVYVDNVLQSMTSIGVGTPATSNINSVPMIMGAFNDLGPLAFFPMTLTQFAYWQGMSCSAGMRTALWNGGTPGDLTSITPQIWYQFSTTLFPADNPNGTIYDRGSLGINGTVNGTGAFSTSIP